MTSIRRKEGKGEDTQKGHVKMVAEIGMMRL